MADLPWEDSLLERKLQSDLKDLLKTLVAFANSVRPGHIAVILIGEKDDGSVQGVNDADNIQKTVRDTCNKIYPPILWRSQTYEKEGRTCVRVEIEYDGETPHFGGAAWIRRGSITEQAPDEVFQRLIDFRLSKVRELAKWIDKEITATPDLGLPFEYNFLGGATTQTVHPRWHFNVDQAAVVRFVNSFWVTLEARGQRISEPLEKIVLSWDDSHNRLRVLIKV
jgi:hypothetical protein